ncbi:MAG: hypothetical protein ACFB6R_11325 [Alphaproteobacteria bacterium]
MSYIEDLRDRVNRLEEALDTPRVTDLQQKLDEQARYSAEISGLLHSLLNAVEDYMSRRAA